MIISIASHKIIRRNVSAFLLTQYALNQLWWWLQRQSTTGRIRLTLNREKSHFVDFEQAVHTSIYQSLCGKLSCRIGQTKSLPTESDKLEGFSSSVQMLGQRRRRCPIIYTELGQSIVSGGTSISSGSVIAHQTGLCRDTASYEITQKTQEITLQSTRPWS